MQMHTKNILSQNRTVDFLKGVCILFVIITHFSWTDNERQMLLFPYWIDMAVPIFMFLSGYVNGISALNKSSSLSELYSLKQVLRKIVRYGSPFFVFYLFEQLLFTFKDWGFTPLDRIFQFFNGGVGQGGYYFPIMIQFIFLFPVIFTIIRKYEEKGLLLCFAGNLLYEVLKSAYFMNEECYRLLVFRYIYVIAAGCLLAKKPSAMVSYKKSILRIATGLIYIFIVMYTEYAPFLFTYWKGRTLLGAMFVIPIVSYMVNQNKVYISIINILGKASYNILFVQMVYYLTLGNKLDNVLPNRWISLLIAIISCCIFGVLFYQIETPVTKKLIIKIGVQK